MIIVVTNHISIFPKMPICLLKLFQTEDRLKEGFPQIISLRLTANIQWRNYTINSITMGSKKKRSDIHVLSV
jgi:hypothetical protein